MHGGPTASKPTVSRRRTARDMLKKSPQRRHNGTQGSPPEVAAATLLPILSKSVDDDHRASLDPIDLVTLLKSGVPIAEPPTPPRRRRGMKVPHDAPAQPHDIVWSSNDREWGVVVQVGLVILESNQIPGLKVHLSSERNSLGAQNDRNLVGESASDYDIFTV